MNRNDYLKLYPTKTYNSDDHDVYWRHLYSQLYVDKNLNGIYTLAPKFDNSNPAKRVDYLPGSSGKIIYDECLWKYAQTVDQKPGCFAGKSKNKFCDCKSNIQ